MKSKKSIIGPIISVFVLILIIAILSGLTFLFVASFKTNVIQTTDVQGTTNNEIGYINQTGDYLNQYQQIGFSNPIILSAVNYSSGGLIMPGNYTLTGNIITNATAVIWNNVSYNYTYLYVPASGADTYLAVNATEASGYTVVTYLPLIFLAIIFGALLTLVLKIILPYINLGNRINTF